MEEHANILHFECIDEYPSSVISHGQSCGSTACPLHSRQIINYLNVFLSADTARSAAAWSPVNCACVPQLFQQLINTMLFPALLRKFVCQPLCCVPLQIQTFFIKILSLSLNTMLIVDKHCSDVCCDEFPVP